MNPAQAEERAVMEAQKAQRAKHLVGRIERRMQLSRLYHWHAWARRRVAHRYVHDHYVVRARATLQKRATRFWQQVRHTPPSSHPRQRARCLREKICSAVHPSLDSVCPHTRAARAQLECKGPSSACVFIPVSAGALKWGVTGGSDGNTTISHSGRTRGAGGAKAGRTA